MDRTVDDTHGGGSPRSWGPETLGLGLRTDLGLASVDGSVIPGPDSIAVKTPTSPGFWWGNFVVFPGPPREGDRARWEAIFDRAFRGLPSVRHRNFTWDPDSDAEGASSEFIEQGYAATRQVFMVHDGSFQPEPLGDFDLRAFDSPSDWIECLEIHHRCLVGEQATDPFRRYQAEQIERYRWLHDSGRGLWVGAYRGGRMVGSAGVYRGEGWARYQAVSTTPEFRGRGAASAILARLGGFAFDAWRVEQLVLMTGDRHPARALYSKLGFRPDAYLRSLSVER